MINTSKTPSSQRVAANRSTKPRTSRRKATSAKASSGQAQTPAQGTSPALAASSLSSAIETDSACAGPAPPVKEPAPRSSLNTTTTEPSSSVGGSRSPDAVVTDSKQPEQGRARRGAPRSAIVVVPSSARGGKVAARSRRSPPSTQKVAVSSLSARKTNPPRVEDAPEAPGCSSTYTGTSRSPLAPAQTSAKLTRVNAPATEVTRSTLPDDRDARSAEPGLSVVTSSSSAPPAVALAPVVVARRRSQPSASPSLSAAAPPAVPTSSPLSSPALGAATAQGTHASGASSSAASPHSTITHSVPTTATGENTSLLRRGVVGPSTGIRRSSMQSTSSSTDSRAVPLTSAPPSSGSGVLASSVIATPLVGPVSSTADDPASTPTPLQEWRHSPPKGILKSGNEMHHADAVAAGRSPQQQLMLGSVSLDTTTVTSSVAAGDSLRGSSTVATSVSRNSTPARARRCVRFDEENLRITGTTDTRAFVEDGPGQMRGGGSVDPNDLNRTRHLRSPQARGLRVRPGRIGAGGWGRDSAWFDNEFGLNPRTRHTPPPASLSLSDSGTSSQSLSAPGSAAGSVSPPGRRQCDTPLRTTFKPNPFAAGARSDRNRRNGTPVPRRDDTETVEITVRRESLLVATPEPFNLQPRKPLLSTYRTTHHCVSHTDREDGDTSQPSTIDVVSMVETPLSPTERQLLDALANSALTSHARREVYIAPDAASRSALESSGTLQITDASARSNSDSPSANRRTQHHAPSSESRGLQRFLCGSPGSEDTDRTSQLAQSVNSSSPCTGTSPTDRSASLTSAGHVSASRSSYQLPTSITGPTPAASAGTPRTLVLKVSSNPSSLSSSSLSASGRPTIVSARPSRLSLSSPASQNH